MADISLLLSSHRNIEFQMAVNISCWSAIECLQKLHMQQYIEIFTNASVTNDQLVNENLSESCIKAIEEVVEGIVTNLAQENAPVLRIPKKTVSEGTSRSSEDFVSGGNPKSARRFAFLMDLLSKSYVLLKNNSFATRRDLFYENVNLYEKQSNVDRALEDAAKMLNVPRRALHITATGKGLIAGNLSFVTHDGTRVIVAEAQQGMLIPSCVRGLTEMRSEARFVLVVEKDATFQKLLDSHFPTTFGPCILVTGKGYPDLATRQMVHRIWVQLHIPILALVDADPFGIHIAAVYKFGSISRTEPNLRVNGLALLGILPTELESLQLPPKALIPLAPCDHGKLASLEAHPSLKEEKAWLHQMQFLRKFGYKAEIQSLTHISQEFLTTIYLPTKISSGNWIV